jgi:hypothetical protein
MQEVQQPLFLCLTSNMLLGIINILAWGVGSSHKVHGCGLRNMTTLLKQFEQAKLPMQNLSKLHGCSELNIGIQ